MCMNSDVNTRTHVQEINGAELGGGTEAPLAPPESGLLGVFPNNNPPRLCSLIFKCC